MCQAIDSILKLMNHSDDEADAKEQKCQEETRPSKQVLQCRECPRRETHERHESDSLRSLEQLFLFSMIINRRLFSARICLEVNLVSKFWFYYFCSFSRYYKWWSEARMMSFERNWISHVKVKHARASSSSDTSRFASEKEFAAFIVYFSWIYVLMNFNLKREEDE